MKFGDKVSYIYLHHLNSKSTIWRAKEAIFIKQEGEKIFIVCKGNKSITKTTIKNIKEVTNE